MIAVVEAADREGAVPVDAFCPVDEQISAGVSRDLFAVLDGLPDPRRTGWRRHRLGYVLAVVFTAFCQAPRIA